MITKKDIELELVSRLLVYPQQSISVSQIIKPEDFDYYGKAYEIILNSFVEEKEVNHEIRKGGFKLSELDGTLSYRFPNEIAKDLKEYANARNVKRVIAEFSKKIPDNNLENFVAELQVNLTNNIESSTRETSAIKDLIEDFQKEREEYLKKPAGSIIGVSTGYEGLDTIIDGLRPEHLWVIGGYTNMGKTFATLNIVANLIAQKKRVVIYSLEMSKNDVISRLLGIMTEQNGLAIMKGTQKNPIEKAIQSLVDSHLSIITNKSEVSDITFSMFEENMKSPVDLFVVDFIQLVTLKNSKSEYETATESILKMQQTAKKLKKPIMVVSQISNDGAKNPDNGVMSFKGSGAIAAAADLAIEIVKGKDETNDTIADKTSRGEPIDMVWVVKKNRHGRLGVIKLEFSGKNGIFQKPLKNF
jgi:replicative DNA helicase